jgi:Domain of unknown function (DUF4919)
MFRFRLSIALAGFLIAAWSTTPNIALAGDDDEASKALDQKFEKLLAAAQKDPKKADWKALRHAFAETSHYQPYNATWRQDISNVAKNLHDGKVKEAEARLIKLLESERFMRVDAHAVALAVYEKLGDSEKARKHKEFLEGLSAAIFVPGHGTSFAKPIEVLFVEEEYTVLGAMGCKMKQQALSERDGHRFDVLTTQAKPGAPERQLFFNIDMPWSSLQRGMMKAFEKSKAAGAKK